MSIRSEIAIAQIIRKDHNNVGSINLGLNTTRHQHHMDQNRNHECQVFHQSDPLSGDMMLVIDTQTHTDSA